MVRSADIDPHDPRWPAIDVPRLAPEPGPGSPLTGPPLDWLQAQLFERRIVVLRGPLDDLLAGSVAAQLMTLDATGDDAVHLHVDSPGGSIGAAFTVMDTMDLLGVHVEVTCLGRAEGAAVGILAVGHHRIAMPSARIWLTAPTSQVWGRASELATWAAEQERALARFVNRVAEATGRPAEHVEADLDAGRHLDADAALAYGLVDEVRTRAASVRPDAPPTDRPPFGFAPPNRE